MSKEFKCSCIWATSKNTKSVRDGSEMGGYVKKECKDCETRRLNSKHKPPALGDDLDDAMRDLASSACQMALDNGVNEDTFLRLARSVRNLFDHAPLQAEIERLNSLRIESTHRMDMQAQTIGRLRKRLDEIDQLKARRDELEGLLREMRNENYTRLKDIANMHDRVDAALSKPAGSENV